MGKIFGVSADFHMLSVTPSAPAAGYGKFYMRDDGRLYTQNSSGVEFQVHDDTINYKRPVKAATTTNITLSGAQTIDTISCVAGDRVLVRAQTTTAQNGIYTVSAGSWTRALDANTSALMAGAVVSTTDGSANYSLTFHTRFRAQDTLGTTGIDWWYFQDNLQNSLTYTPLSDPHLFRDARAVQSSNVSLASATVTVDGVTLVAGDRVLLVAQTTASQNGIYTVGTVTTGNAPLTRDSHFNTSLQLANAGVIEITEGTTYGGTSWVTSWKTSNTLDTTAMAWTVLWTGAGAGYFTPSILISPSSTFGQPQTLAAGSPGSLVTSAVSPGFQTTANNQSALTTPFKDWVVAATTANITLSGTQTIDGVSVTAGQRVLVKNQTTASQNGVYLCAAGSWTRTTGFDTTAEASGSQVVVAGGTVNGGTTWFSTFKTGNTLGTTAMTFLPVSLSATYTPAWTAVTTAPVLNNGTAVGNYVITGNMCWFNLIITSGSTTTYGSGQYSFSLPPSPYVPADAVVLYGSAVTGTNPYTFVAVPSIGAGTLTVKALPTTAGASSTNVSNTFPATWASGTSFRFTGSYRWA